MVKHGIRLWQFLLAATVIALFISACASETNSIPSPASNRPTSAVTPPGNIQNGRDVASPSPAGNQQGPGQTTIPAQQADDRGPATYTPDVTFTLRTEIAEGGMTFVGVGGGAIDGEVNPTLRVRTGDVVQVTLINGDGAAHDVSFPDSSTLLPTGWSGSGRVASLFFEPVKLGSSSTSALSRAIGRLVWRGR